MKLAMTLLLTLFATQAISMDKVIYGIDNRMDIFETPDQDLVDLAASTAAMVPNHKISEGLYGDDSDVYTLNGTSLGAANRLCKDEKFYKQITPANCSGFLVAPDLLVTAGHCVRTSRDCSGNRWVFDFSVKEEGVKANKVTKDDVYRCVEIIDRKLGYDKNDYALLRLDREVVGRKPLEVRTEGSVRTGTDLVMIGHPSGLPTKIAPGAYVRNNLNSIYFKANTDSFGGNSGSAVFNAETGKVEGILVRGERDYAYDSASRCYRVNYCEEEGCRGEDVTRITNIRRLMEILKNR